MGILGAILFHKLGQRIGYSKGLALSYFMWCVGIIFAFLLLVDSSRLVWSLLVFPIFGISIGGRYLPSPVSHVLTATYFNMCSISQARAVFSSLIPPGQVNQPHTILKSENCLSMTGLLCLI